MALIEIRLRPTGPWRAGHRTGDRERVDAVYHSDALYSAVTHAMSSLGWLEEWLDATARAHDGSVVRFSSLFPVRRRHAASSAAAHLVAAFGRGKALRQSRETGAARSGAPRSGERIAMGGGWRERVPASSRHGSAVRSIDAIGRGGRPHHRTHGAASHRLPRIRAERGLVGFDRDRRCGLGSAREIRVASAGRFRIRRRTLARMGPGGRARILRRLGAVRWAKATRAHGGCCRSTRRTRTTQSTGRAAITPP